MPRLGGLQFWMTRGALSLICGGVLVMLGCRTQQSPQKPAVPLSSHETLAGNESVETFREAKRHVYRLFTKRLRTFYCDCAYAKRVIDSKRCTFKSRLHAKRALRTEIEHVVPVHAFGQSFRSWREGNIACVDRNGRRFKGRRCASRTSELFKRMSSDLYNLRPAVGAVNALRSNFRMGVVAGEARVYGACDMEIENRVFEPKLSIRGDIARIYFYMDAAYPGHGILGKKQLKLLKVWHRADPVSEDERTLALEIKEIQGNDNPFVTLGMEPR